MDARTEAKVNQIAADVHFIAAPFRHVWNLLVLCSEPHFNHYHLDVFREPTSRLASPIGNVSEEARVSCGGRTAQFITMFV